MTTHLHQLCLGDEKRDGKSEFPILWYFMPLFVVHNIQVLYEFAFCQLAPSITSGFQLFRAIPRVHVPLSDVTTISEEGLRSSDMLVVECDSESQLHQFGDPGSTLGLCEVWEVSRDSNIYLYILMYIKDWV